jgi:homoserine dehydrogenase
MNKERTSSSTGVTLLGCGTVGTGVLRLLVPRGDFCVRAVGVRDLKKKRNVSVDMDLMTDDLSGAVCREDVSVVVEVMGGIEPARSLILEALGAGKHVVTANKALLAQHGHEILERARQMGVLVLYEAAVAGGVPVVRALRESLTGDRIQSFHGIINGTSNFMMSQMFDEGVSFDDALAEAQKLGFAEADPSADVDGHDAAQKLHILMHLGFGLSLDEGVSKPRGIRSLKPLDFRHAEAFGFRIKPLAVARRVEGGVAAWVGPALVPSAHVLANIGGVFNACFLHSEGLGALLLSGRGAGMMPTAVSVIGDMIECARTSRGASRGHDFVEVTSLQDMGETMRSFYLRFTVKDEPGVLGRIASALGEYKVSIERLVQEEQGDRDYADIVVLTHQTEQKVLKAALDRIDSTDFLVHPTLWIPVENPDN